MSGQHVRLRNERTVAHDLGKRDNRAPRHRANVERVIAQTSRYSIVEDALTGETHTVWAVDSVVEL